jgi:uncharacterized protein
MSLPARIDVFDFATHGQSTDGVITVAALPRLASSLRVPTGELQYRYQGLTDAQRRPAGHLLFQARVLLTCDRCNGPLDYDLTGDSSFFYVRDEKELHALPLDPEAASEPLVGSRRFDLATAVEDEAILLLPLSPRHANCPIADGAATVTAGAGSQPFADLAQLKRRG